MTNNHNANWNVLCKKNDLIPHSGVAALHNGQQIALFYIPGYETEVFATCNNDPFSGANILARGIVGNLQDEPMVASPLYKQHFSLKSGVCMEDEEIKIRVWPVRLQGEHVEIIAA